MADRQYPPLAEPLTLPTAQDPPLPLLPWLEALPVRKVRLRDDGLSALPGLVDPTLPVLSWRDGPVLRPRPLRLEGASPAVGQADAVVTVPDLVTVAISGPVPRRLALRDPSGGQRVSIVDPIFPGDLTSTVVAGHTADVIVPSGLVGETGT